jgi:type IV pilus assembly protein PilE
MKSRGIEQSRIGRTAFLNARKRCRGFKLVEFLVVLAVASTLGIGAVSASWGSSEDRLQTKRANARFALAEIAQLEEAHFLLNKRYTHDLGSKGLDIESTTTPGGHYALRVELPEDACPFGYCYVLSAVPQGAQAEDTCGTLTLTSDGTKLPAGCW